MGNDKVDELTRRMEVAEKDIAKLRSSLSGFLLTAFGLEYDATPKLQSSYIETTTAVEREPEEEKQREIAIVAQSEIKFLRDMLAKCERAAKGWPDGPAIFTGACDALAAVEELRTKYNDAIKELV